MRINVGSFNLNNLFSRLNISAARKDLSEGETAGAMTFRYEFGADDISVRTYHGKLVKAKPREDTIQIAKRILDMDLDVLAVQEVENIHIWTYRHRHKLSGQYPILIIWPDMAESVYEATFPEKLHRQGNKAWR